MEQVHWKLQQNIRNGEVVPSQTVAHHPSIPATKYKKLVDLCGQHITYQHRMMSMLSPASIALASPLIICALVGPGALHMLKQQPQNTEDDVAPYLSNSIETHFVELVIGRFAHYWCLGDNVLGKR